jgi:hypothetical protein
MDKILIKQKYIEINMEKGQNETIHEIKMIKKKQYK